MSEMINRTSGLVINSIQIDYFTGGVLENPGSEVIIPALNQYLTSFQIAKGSVFVIRDWHPANHMSFRERGGKLPIHCVRGTRGADLHADIHIPYGTTVVSKGVVASQDPVSGFDRTDLELRLREKGVDKVFFAGLDIEESFRLTVLDAIRLGFNCYLLTDAIFSKETNTAAFDRALREMKFAGAKLIEKEELTVIHAG